MNSPLNDYRKTMKKIEPGEALIEKAISLTSGLARQASESPLEKTTDDMRTKPDGTVKPPSITPNFKEKCENAKSEDIRKPQRISRRRFFAAAAAIVAGAVMAPSAIRMAEFASSGRNDFALLAYASEAGEDASASQPERSLSAQFFSSTGGWGAQSFEITRCASNTWRFNFSFRGKNVTDLKLSFPCDDLPSQVEKGDFVGFYVETPSFDEGGRAGASAHLQESITIDELPERNARGEYTSFDASSTCFITASTPATQETMQRWEEYDALFSGPDATSPKKKEELLLAFTAHLNYEAAMKLAQKPLHVTAQFADGSTQEQRFEIRPAEDYVQRVIDQGLHSTDNGLYIIEMLR